VTNNSSLARVSNDIAFISGVPVYSNSDDMRKVGQCNSLLNSNAQMSYENQRGAHIIPGRADAFEVTGNMA